MVVVSLAVKSHSQDIFQCLKDVIQDLVDDLEIVARNGAFLTSKLLVFGIFPQISEYLCVSCAGGHDTVTIVIPDTDVEVVREAFKELLDGDITEIEKILGCEKKFQNLQNIQKITLDNQTTTKNTEEDQYPIKVETALVGLPQNPTLQVQGIQSEKGYLVYPCLDCEKVFDTKKKVARHIRWVHKGGAGARPPTSYVCKTENCGAVYTSFRAYKFCKCKTKKRNRQKNSDKAKDPWNKCFYKCEMCGKTFTDRRTLRSHIVHKHQVDYVNEYITAFGDPSVSNPKWSCGLCTSAVKFERRSISSHLVQHNLDILEYGKMYGEPGQ